MVGIISYGAYIPIYRLNRDLLSQVWGKSAGPGERAIANWDEDSITMAVEAGIDCLTGLDRQCSGLYFASTNPPYREKQCATTVASALDLPEELFTADFTNSLRSGTNALRAAADAAKGNPGNKVLVLASDNRLPAPDSPLEGQLGDGSAGFLIGTDNVAVEIEATYAIYSDFMDTWRIEHEKYPVTWEDRFILVEGYQKMVPQAVNGFLKRHNFSQNDFSKLVLFAPDARRHQAMSKTLGFDYKNQVQPAFFNNVGHTGCAFVPMMLVAALEDAKAGDRILLVNYSDGVDVMSLKVTEQIENIRDRRGIKGHLESKMPLSHYGRYLHFRDLMEWEFERRPPYVSALPVMWRERKQITSFYGGKCNNCKTVQYPIQRVCAHCQAKDDFEEISLSSWKGTVTTFSLDQRTMVKDLPCVNLIVDFDKGGRYICTMTDRDPNKVKVGMPVELTFRKFHDGSRLHNYSWMARPLRVK